MGDKQMGEHLPRFIRLKDETGNEYIHYNTISTDTPEEVKLYAEKELNETEENKQKGLQKLRAYLKKENLPEIEDSYLIAILRCCKYDLKKSQVKLKRFLNVRRMIIKNSKNLDSKKLDHLIDDGISECLPWSDKNGRPIYVFRPNLNLDNYDYQDIAAYCQACLFSVLKYPLPTINGVVIIVDCNVKSPAMIFQMLNEYRKYIGLEKTVPIRIGRIDFVNENVIAHYAFALVRPFLPSKIVERIAFHGSDMKNLHKVYNPDILPEDFCGKMGSIDTKIFKEERLKVINKLKSEINV